MEKKSKKKRRLTPKETPPEDFSPGTCVTITEETALQGLEWNRRALNLYLKIGKTYTVKKTLVYEWDTQVYLEGFPTEVGFNSRNFVVISKEEL